MNKNFNLLNNSPVFHTWLFEVKLPDHSLKKDQNMSEY